MIEYSYSSVLFTCNSCNLAGSKAMYLFANSLFAIANAVLWCLDAIMVCVISVGFCLPKVTC